MEEKLKNCFNTNIPETDDTDLECNSFILSKCVIEDDKTQEEINEEVQNKLDELTDILSTFITNQNNYSSNNVVVEVDLGTVVTPATSVNNLPTFPISKDEIFVFKGTVGLTPYKWLFKKGKGVYGTGGTATNTTDFLEL